MISFFCKKNFFKLNITGSCSKRIIAASVSDVRYKLFHLGIYIGLFIAGKQIVANSALAMTNFNFKKSRM